MEVWLKVNEFSNNDIGNSIAVKNFKIDDFLFQKELNKNDLPIYALLPLRNF